MSNVYIPDTNVLVDLLRGEAGYQADRSGGNKRQLAPLLSGEHHVVIPMHTFLETAYQFFQIRIDLDNYPRWYRQRKIVFNQILVHPIMNNENITLLREIPGQYYAANRTMEPIHDVYLEKIRTIAENKKQYQAKTGQESRKDPRDPKFLDGMDAAILEEAIYVAQSRPNDRCMLLTSDMTLNFAVNRLSEAYGRYAAFCPKNLFALYPGQFPYSRKKRSGNARGAHYSQA